MFLTPAVPARVCWVHIHVFLHGRAQPMHQPSCVTAKGVGARAGIPRVKPQWSDKYLKIMIVGESGLGAAAHPCRPYFCIWFG